MEELTKEEVIIINKALKVMFEKGIKGLEWGDKFGQLLVKYEKTS